MKIKQEYADDTDDQLVSNRTPIKQRLRKSKISQTERKVKKVKGRRLSSCEMSLDFTATTPIIEKIKKKQLLAQDIISPSKMFVNVERLRLSQLGLQKHITSPSVQFKDVTDCKSNQSDISMSSTDVQTRKYVVHPRFFENNNCSSLIESNDFDGAIEDTLNSTFTLSPDEENLTHIDKKGTNIEDSDGTNSKSTTNESNRRRTFDKKEISVNDIDNFYSDNSLEPSMTNFSNVTLRKQNSCRDTFNSIDNSSNVTEYHSPNRLTLNKIATNIKNVSQRSFKQDSRNTESFASCNDVDKNIEIISLLLNEKSAIISDNNSKFTAACDERLTFDMDDIKHIKDSSIINVKENIEDDLENVNNGSFKHSTLDNIKIHQSSPPVSWRDIKGFHAANKNSGFEKERKRPSIMQKLSKNKKPKNEFDKLSTTSKTISRSSHLISSARTPKISGSKAFQLYEFLCNKPCENTLPHEDKVTHDSIILENSPPSGSSTPKILKKHVVNSLLKSTLKKQNNNVTIADVSRDTTSFKKKFVSGKMPNFALLHKKQFDKMENISDYSERKSERAKLLLSGTKPHNESSSFRLVNKKIVRPLLLDSTVEKKSAIETNTNDSVVVPDKHASIYSNDKENIGELENTDGEAVPKNTKKVTLNLLPETPDKKSHGMLIRKTPFKVNLKSNIVMGELEEEKDNIVLISSPLPEAEKPLFNLPRVQLVKPIIANNKDKIKPSNPRNFLAKSNVSRKGLIKNTNPANNNIKQRTTTISKNNDSKSTGTNPQEKTGHTRFGFTVPVKLKKEDAVKAISNKTHIPKTNQQEEKRAIIKGVRSNRRFDLLMEMRNKK